jgi:hypothetical protein
MFDDDSLVYAYEELMCLRKGDDIGIVVVSSTTQEQLGFIPTSQDAEHVDSVSLWSDGSKHDMLKHDYN